MKTICVANKKGGVGKTTLSFNLIHYLEGQGARVLAIDNDAQGDLSGSFVDKHDLKSGLTRTLYTESPDAPIEVTERISLYAADPKLTMVDRDDLSAMFTLGENLRPYEDAFDFCVIDCAPSLGNSTFAGMLASDGLLIPLSPTHYAVDGLAEMIKTHRRVRDKLGAQLEILGVLFNQVDSRTVLAREMMDMVRDDLGELCFEATLPKAIKIEESPGTRLPVRDYAPGSAADKAFKRFISEFNERVGNLHEQASTQQSSAA